jgi:hypothetical protein
MKLRYLSDLHLEFLTKSKLEKIITHIIPGVTNEICILAGDIGNPISENYDIFMIIIRFLTLFLMVPVDPEKVQL